MNFCLDDGSPLQDPTGHLEETVVMQPPGTAAQHQWATQPAGLNTGKSVEPQRRGSRSALPWVVAVLAFLAVGCGGGLALLAYLGLQSDMAEKYNTSASPSQTDVDKPSKQEPASDDSVTLAKFEAIKTGMRRAQVEEIMGRKGSETFNSDVAGMKFISLEWKDGPFKMILVSFQNDKVTSKMQIGLSD